MSASSTPPSALTTSSPFTKTYLSDNPSAVYLGPLTTIFSPPSTCFSIVTKWNEEENVIFHGIQGDPACYPGDVRVLSEVFDAYYYSPGVCPSGFTEACQDRGQWDVGLPGITASLCCPSGYTCGAIATNNIAPYCESTATTTLDSVWMGTSAPMGVPATASFTTLDPPQRVWLNAVPIAWQSTDEVIRARATRSTESSSRAISSSARAPTSAPTATPTPGGPQAGLSTGAKVAVGVCVPLAVIATALLAFFLVQRRKTRDGTEKASVEYQKAELSATEGVKTAPSPQEMDASVEQKPYVPYDGPPLELYTEERRDVRS